MNLTYESIAKRIDHSLLGPTLTDSELREGCELALRYDVASVCIKPYAVFLAAEILRGSTVAVGTTVGFPHGGHETIMKAFEAQRALLSGATELDMVINVGWALSGLWHELQDEIAVIAGVAHEKNAIVKVIFENCYLKPEHIVRLCKICGEVRADYVKTSTGYGTGGASHDDLRLMRESSPSHVKLKAAGGVRDLDSLIAVVDLGCDRVGASRTSAILDDLRSRLKLPPIAFPETATPRGAISSSQY